MPDVSLQQTLFLGHSPDPDDAFMFYGLAKGLVDTGRWRFEHVLQDIQTLNERALRGELHITAISIHAYPYVADKYALTNCGSSMGDGYGPMVVAREPMDIDSLRGKKIAVPGEMTTAFLALNLLLGAGTFEHEVVMFDEILDHVAADHRVRAGQAGRAGRGAGARPLDLAGLSRGGSAPPPSARSTRTGSRWRGRARRRPCSRRAGS